MAILQEKNEERGQLAGAFLWSEQIAKTPNTETFLQRNHNLIRLVCSRIYAPVHCCKQQNNQPAISVVVTERVEESPTSINSYPRKIVGKPKTVSP